MLSRLYAKMARGAFDGERVAAHYTSKDGLPNDDVMVIYEDRHGLSTTPLIFRAA